MMRCSQLKQGKEAFTCINDASCVFEQWGVLIDEGNKSYSKGLMRLTLKSYRQALELIVMPNSKMLLHDSEAIFAALSVSIKNISIASVQFGKEEPRANAYRVATRYLQVIIEDKHQLPRIRNSANTVFNELMCEWDDSTACYANGEMRERQALTASTRYQKQFYH